MRWKVLRSGCFPRSMVWRKCWGLREWIQNPQFRGSSSSLPAGRDQGLPGKRCEKYQGAADTWSNQWDRVPWKDTLISSKRSVQIVVGHLFVLWLWMSLTFCTSNHSSVQWEKANAVGWMHIFFPQNCVNFPNDKLFKIFKKKLNLDLGSTNTV